MKVLIIGCGAIGGHIACCLYKAGHKVLVITRNKTLKTIQKEGLFVQINQNNKIVSKNILRIDERFKIYKSFNAIKNIKLDAIFITVKLKDYNKNLIKKVNMLSNNKTAIIPPCTNIPFWFVKKYFNKKIKFKNEYFNIKNIIGMTMWLSSEKKGDNKIYVKHVQRGYPLKALNKKMDLMAKKLRSIFNSQCKSPPVKNIYSEVFIKSLNALTFNIAALVYEQNNKLLNKNKKAHEMIKKISLEGESIIESLGVKHYQSYKKRIKQTFSSSVHTMSMLNDFKNGKKVELKYLWNSFLLVSKLSNIKMPYTKKIYQELIKKLK